MLAILARLTNEPQAKNTIFFLMLTHRAISYLVLILLKHKVYKVKFQLLYD